jgi:hypothetical protein
VPVPSQQPSPAAAAAGNLPRSSSASGTLPQTGMHRIKSGACVCLCAHNSPVAVLLLFSL